ncbi:MAG TPA: trypsin-like peptidase domain-containing protein [Gemmatimonadaceae bacterium]|nr:trypsin-like peptidase domain-containing protein [Gemmatimonadaceae bacterium]
MSVELRVLSGARAGHREVFAKPVVAIGRHPMSDLQFDPDGDRDVSARHAEIREHDGRCTVRDVGSTNGTFVNGRRIADDDEHLLISGDVISFGELGPKIEFRFSESGADFSLPAGPPRTRMSSTPRPPAPSPAHQPAYQGHADAPPYPPPPHAGAKGHYQPPPQPHYQAPREQAPQSPAGLQSGDAEPPILFPKRPTNERVAMAVQEQTRPLRYALFGLGGVLLAVVGAGVWMQRRDARERSALIASLTAQNDSARKALEQAIRDAKGAVGGLDSALKTAQRDNEELQRQLAVAKTRNDRASLAALQQRVNQNRAKQQEIVRVAQMDHSAIYAKYNAAIVMISIEQPDGKSFIGTGFSITRDGLIVTNKHLILGEAGQQPRRVAAIYADTKAWIPAHVVKTSAAEDFAFIKLDIEGDYPRIDGIARTSARAQVGAPVAIIGYPFGTELPMEGTGTRVTARASLFVGTVSKLLADVMQIDSYAGEGSSGSPVFDSSGSVVGVVYGGARESGGRIVYAVPSERLIGELPSEAAGIVR